MPDPTECYWVLLCAFCLVGLLPPERTTVICDEQLIGSGVTSNQSNVGSHHSGYDDAGGGGGGKRSRTTFNVKGREAKYCTMNELFCIPGNYSK